MYASTFALALLVASFRGASAAVDRPACVNFTPVGKILLGSGFAHAPFRVDLGDRLQTIARLCRAARDGRVQERCGTAFGKATAALEGLGARVANPEAVVGDAAVLLELGHGLDQAVVVANLSGTFGHAELGELIKAGAKASRGRRVRVTSEGLVAERRAVAGSAAGANRVGDLGGEQQQGVKVRPESLALEAESLAGELGDLAGALKDRRFPFAEDNPEVLESLRQLLHALAGQEQRFAHPPVFLAEMAEVSYQLGKDGALDIVGHFPVAPVEEDLTIYRYKPVPRRRGDGAGFFQAGRAGYLLAGGGKFADFTPGDFSRCREVVAGHFRCPPITLMNHVHAWRGRDPLSCKWLLFKRKSEALRYYCSLHPTAASTSGIHLKENQGKFIEE